MNLPEYDTKMNIPNRNEPIRVPTLDIASRAVYRDEIVPASFRWYQEKSGDSNGVGRNNRREQVG